MSFFTSVAKLGRVLTGKRHRGMSSSASLDRVCRFETMEPRQMMSANPQIHFGSVFFDPAPGKDTTPNTIQVTFQGGQPGTTLTQLVIDGSQQQQGLAAGDIVWNTNNAPVTVVSHNGFQVVSETTANNGTQIVINLSGFVAGDMLVLSADADKVQSITNGTPALVPLARGNDFQDSHLIGTFAAAHYENVTINTSYVAGYDEQFAANDATVGNTLGLPPQDYMPPSTTDQSNQTAGASVLISQTPLPISIGGTVFADQNLNNAQDNGETGVAGVSLSLQEFNGTQFVSTGKTTTTDASGNYLFQFLLPGTYQVVETVPSNYFAVGAQAGTDNGVADGTVVNATGISQIAVLGGDNSVENNFGIAQGVALSGYVYHDANNNGIREAGEQGIGGVTIVVTPVATLDGSTAPVQTITAADGSWSVVGLAPGKYTVQEVTQPPGYLDGKTTAGSFGGSVVQSIDEIQNVSLLGGQAGTEYDFGKLLPATISGSVADCLTSQPLAGVVMQLLDANGNVLQTTTTATDGTYKFSGLSPFGIYGVHQILPTGYMNNDAWAGSVGGTVAADDDSITQVALGDGTQATAYNFCDVRPASLAGAVADCLTDQPLSGVTVQLLDATGKVVQTTTTNAGGGYQFNNLTPGQIYGVAQVLPTGYMNNDAWAGSAGGTVAADDNSITQVSLGDGVNAVSYNFCDVKPTSLAGTVADCLTDTPLSGVTVQLLDANNNVLQTTTTNAQGAYQFTNLKPGEFYGVSEVLPTGYMNNDTESGSAGGTVAANLLSITQVSLGDGVNATGYDFCDVRPATISGDVADCLADKPLAGVTVQLLDAGGNVLQTTTTDEAGDYQFTNLKPGQVYGVRQLLPTGYLDHDAEAGSAGGVVAADFNSITQITLGDNTQATNYDFCDVLPASISGSVVNCDLGTTLSGVTVKLLDSNGKVLQTTVTDANGNYSFGNLMPGLSYGVSEVLPAGYLNNDAFVGSAGGTAASDDNSITQVSLTDGVNATDYVFCDVQPITISGFVKVDTTGDPSTATNLTPLAGVTVNLLDSEQNVVATMVTDSNGAFSFTGKLPPDTYTLQSVTPSNYFAEEADPGSAGGDAIGPDTIGTIVLTSGTNSVNNDFYVDPPGTISGVVFQDGGPITLPQGVTLTAQDVPSYRTGVYQPGDKPIAGVTIFLGNADGQLILDNNLNPMSTVTDANGFYQFKDLPAGTYTVFQLPADQPNPNLIPGLSTAGDTGGIALNPNTVLSPSIIAELAIPSSTTAIIQIPLAIGGNSVQNNFSVVVTQSTPVTPPPPPLLPPPPTPPIPPPPSAPVVEFNPPVSTPAPVGVQAPVLLTGYTIGAGGYQDPYTWHLSIIDGGQPREGQADGQASDAEGAVGQAAYANSWMGMDMSKGQWTVNAGNGDPNLMYVFGTPGAIPVQGDFLGDGKTRMGVFVDGEWYIDMNGNGVWDEGDLYCKLGGPGDTPVVGDWDGDGKDDIGVYGPAWPNDAKPLNREPGLPVAANAPTGAKKNMPPTTAEAATRQRTMQFTSKGKLRTDVIDHVFQYGQPGDIPVVGDWTGNGVKTIGVFRNGVWHLDVKGDGKWGAGDIEAHFGQDGDIPVVGDWDGSGVDSIGVYRGGKWYLDTNHNFQLDDHDEVRQLGEAGDTPVVGHFTGTAKTEIGVYHNGTVQRLDKTK